MNDISQKIYEILRSELSEITSRTILVEKTKKVGKDLDTLQKDDLKNLIPLILGPVLLFGGGKKAQIIKEKLSRLSD
jgi:hypothetical protein